MNVEQKYNVQKKYIPQSTQLLSPLIVPLLYLQDLPCMTSLELIHRQFLDSGKRWVLKMLDTQQNGMTERIIRTINGLKNQITHQITCSDKSK